MAGNPIPTFRWRRDRVAGIFAEQRYLSHWQSPVELGPRAQPQQPVVWVSWFAANAYCESLGARLPTWSEWEYAAAADETRKDARKDPAWRERILAWYSRPSNSALPRAGLQAANLVVDGYPGWIGKRREQSSQNRENDE